MSALTNLTLEISVGVGGAGKIGDYRGNGGKGGDGAVQYTIVSHDDTVADVVPLTPTSWGTMTKTALNVTFPNLGSGMWTLFCDGGVNMDIGWVDVGNDREVFCHKGMTTFISSKTPVRTRGGWSNNKTIHYLFYKMGSWA